MPDAEVEAMGKVADALADLHEGERARVLKWAADRYGVTIKKSRVAEVEDEDDSDDLNDASESNGDGGKRSGFEHFAELYDTVDPSSDPERVLVACYWVQVLHGKETFGSQELNKMLKDLGHGVGTINKAMSTNIDKRPALILQVARGGSTQQARKKYKLTDAGKKWVAERLKSKG